MNLYARGLALVLATAAGTAAVAAPKAPKAPATAAATPITAQTLADPRQKVSYMVGLDIAQSLAPVAPDIDVTEFGRAIRNAITGGKPYLTPEQARTVGPALMKRIASRKGSAPAGTTPPDVSKQQVADLVGADVGRSLAPIREELDLNVVLQALRSSFAGEKPLMDEAQRNTLRDQFSHQLQTRMQAKAAAAAGTNKAAGAKFLAENKAKKGVFTTPSGLQYMVLRQGAGARPRPTDRVRVNYQGALLDGTVFDSSYDRGQPVEFMLNQVIPGWTEGVALMPVGAKYRFWIPSELGYGEKGAGEQIGPNSTLVFDVELLAIPQ